MLTLKEIIVLKFNNKYAKYKSDFPLMFETDLVEKIRNVLDKYNYLEENTITYTDDDYDNPIYIPIYFSFNNLYEYPLQLICRVDIPYSVDLKVLNLKLNVINILLTKGFKRTIKYTYHFMLREDGPYIPYKRNWKHTQFYKTKYTNNYVIEDFYRKK